MDADRVLEFTFFVDADSYDGAGAELAAEWQDLVDHGVEHVDLPPQYPHDLAHRVPVRVRATAHGLRFYARLLHLTDPLQLGDLERILSAHP
jgi:hypothetical protein